MTNSEFEPLLRGAANDAERRLLASAKGDASRPGAREEMLAALGVPPLATTARARWNERILRGLGVSPVHGVVFALLVGAGVGAGALFGASDAISAGSDHRTGAVAAAGHEAPSDPGHLNTEDGLANAPAVTPDSLPSAPAPDAPRAKVVPANTGASSGALTDALDREIARIEAARTALRRNEAGRTLHLLDGYDREFPRGAFAVEVSVLRIEALVKAGRVEDARRLGSRFLAEHREGAFARRVSATLATAPGGAPPAETPPSRSSLE